MIERYEIKKINGKEELFLYFNLDYEFSMKDFHNKRKEIEEVIKEFIIKNKIAFQGNLVTILVGGVLVGNVYLNNQALKKINPNNEPQITYVTKGIRENITDYPVLPTIEDKQEEIMETNVSKESSKPIDNIVQKNESAKVVKTKVETKPVIKEEQKIVSKEEAKPAVKEEIKEEENVPTKEVKKEEPKQEEVVDNNIYVNVLRNGKEEKIELETYIIGVVGAEMPASFHIEALKSQAVIARTYALKARSQGKTLKANEANQSYKTVDELKALWQGSFNTYYENIKKAVNETKGMYLTFNGKYIEAVYHSTSNGKTEASANVWGNSYPYLVTVDSIYDKDNKSFTMNKEMTYQEVSNKLGMEINQETEFNITSLTDSGRVFKIKINEQEMKGTDFRNKLGLRSTDFKIEKRENTIIFTTKGYGHGVGLSQYGANGYAKSGMNYKDILKHYYPGTTLKN